jgi:hypothetical protein
VNPEPDTLPLFPRRPTGLDDRRLHAFDHALREAMRRLATNEALWAAQRELAAAVARKVAGEAGAARVARRMADPHLAAAYEVVCDLHAVFGRLRQALRPLVELYDRRRRRRHRKR